MDVSALVLNKLLLEKNLDIWAKLKLAFIDASYSSVYSAVNRYYDKYGALPSFDELELTLQRDSQASKTVATLRLIDEPDISGEVALDALIDQYTQYQTVSLLDKFVDKLPQFDSAEIKANLSDIVLKLDEKTLTTEGVYTMADISIFRTKEELSRERVYLGLNNDFDAALNGVARQELILIGGPRGGGKSITASNLTVNQYEAGNSCVYFSIEMIAHEVVERKLAMLANVNYSQLKQGTLPFGDMLKVVKARAGMFSDSQSAVDDFLDHKDLVKFEQSLIREKSLKEDNQIIVIDDRALSLTSIDLHLGKLKARFKDKLTMCVVDYLNQIVLESGSPMANQFDWIQQVIISKKLKELARKHEVVMISPYQVDASGEARFAKGILDAADIALLMEVHDKDKGVIGFNTTKIRGGPPMDITSPINWDTLRISPNSVPKPEKQEKVKRAGKKETSAKVEEIASDTPPWD